MYSSKDWFEPNPITKRCAPLPAPQPANDTRSMIPDALRDTNARVEAQEEDHVRDTEDTKRHIADQQ